MLDRMVFSRTSLVCLFGYLALNGCSSDSTSTDTSNGGAGGAAGTAVAGETGLSGSAGAGAAGESSGGDAGSGGQAADTGGASGTPADAGAGQAGELPVREGPMELTSPTFEDEGMLDPDYLCQGNNTSPPLDWTPGPDGTLSYAATMVHLPERSFHWALWDIPASLFSLPEDIEKVANPPYPEGSKQHKADLDGFTFYGHIGGCPGGPNAGPGSSGRYEYEVMALDVATLPGVTTESSSQDVIAALAAHKLEGAVIVGVGSSDSFQ